MISISVIIREYALESYTYVHLFWKEMLKICFMRTLIRESISQASTLHKT